MYTPEDFKKIVEENNLKTKILDQWGKSSLIMVPTYKEYNLLFGKGKTPTCYAQQESCWKSYHEGISREVDFITTRDSISNNFRYLTLCFRHITIKKREFNKGGYADMEGSIIIHDLHHVCYPTMKFESQFCKTKDNGIYPVVSWIDCNYNRIEDYIKLRKLEEYVEKRIIAAAILYVTIDVANKELKKGILK